MFKSGLISTQVEAGRPAVLRAALADGEDNLIARIVIDKAKSGDSGAARFLLGLLCPRPRGRAIALDLPTGARAGDVVAVFNATLRALAAGEITPDEALTITRVLDGRIRMLKTWQLERQMRRREAIPGDEIFAAETRDSEDAAEPSPCSQRSFASPDATAGTSGARENGRVQREGASPANNLHWDDTPHPPIAEEAMGPPEQLSKGLSRKGRGDDEAPAAPPPHLHSACIQPLPATIAGRREVAAQVLAEVLRDMR
jgi:hypothetical protein